MAKKKKIVFVTFSSKYLKTQINPSYQDFVSVVKNTALLFYMNGSNKEDGGTAKTIYSEALEAIQKADCLIAEVLIDSIGVGQQITYPCKRKNQLFSV